MAIFLIEDDPDLRRACVQALALADLDVQPFETAETALAAFAQGQPDVVVTDLRLPGMDGLGLLRHIKERDAELPVILITGHGDVGSAVQAMRDGAVDFFEKPFPTERLVHVLRGALLRRQLILENRRLQQTLEAQSHPTLIGHSKVMQTLRHWISMVGPTSADVLLLGDTGTGKEMVARALHAASGRQGPFVAINCAALPESMFESEMFGHEIGAFTGAARRRVGKFEYAQHGTVFLDEIESMPLSLQAKVLRILQERQLERLGGNGEIPLSFRAIAAAKGSLRQAIDEGRFREDLFFRLDVVSTELPPLRERKEDIPQLMQHFVALATQRYGNTLAQWQDADLRRWQSHDWPGNIRELRNVAERLCLGLPDGLSRHTPDDPPPPAQTDTASTHPHALSAQMERAERMAITQALEACGGHVAQAAERLELPRKTLYDKIARLGLDLEAFRQRNDAAAAAAALKR